MGALSKGTSDSILPREGDEQKALAFARLVKVTVKVKGYRSTTHRIHWGFSGGGGGNRTPVRRPSTRRHYVRSLWFVVVKPGSHRQDPGPTISLEFRLAAKEPDGETIPLDLAPGPYPAN